MFWADIHAVVHEDTDLLVVDTIMNDADTRAIQLPGKDQTVSAVKSATIAVEKIL
jgi:hypothetical protein